MKRSNEAVKVGPLSDISRGMSLTEEGIWTDKETLGTPMLQETAIRGHSKKAVFSKLERGLKILTLVNILILNF